MASFVAYALSYLIHSTLAAALVLPLSSIRGVTPALRRAWSLSALSLPFLTASVPLFWNAPQKAVPHAANGWQGALDGPSLALDTGSHGAHPLLILLGLVAFLWAIAALVRGARLLNARRALKHALDQRTAVTDGAQLALLDRLGCAAGLTSAVALSHSPTLRSPSVLSRREICVPSALLQSLSVRQLEAVLAHEVAHLVQRDWLWFPVVAWLDVIGSGQPLNRLLTRAFRRDAELCCDDLAATLTQHPRRLAQALLRVAEFCVERRTGVLLAEMNTQSGFTLQRVQRLLRAPATPTARARWMHLGPALLLLVVAPFGVRGAAVTTAPDTHRGAFPPSLQDELVELAEQRHFLDVALQTALWDEGADPDSPEILRLHAEIDRLDELDARLRNSGKLTDSAP